MKQTSFASAEYARKRRTTRRERFLWQMDRLVPWARLHALIEPHYPASGRAGGQPLGLDRMLRMHFLQHWYGLADEAIEDALYDSHAMREFVGIDLGRESVPDATTLLRFRRLLDRQGLARPLADAVAEAVQRGGWSMRRGLLADASLVALPVPASARGTATARGDALEHASLSANDEQAQF